MKWLVYGLLANHKNDHDLRFIEASEKPLDVVKAHPEYEAFMSFPEETADQLDQGGQISGAGGAAALFLGLPVRFPNASEKASL